MSTRTPYFSPAMFDFLVELQHNNNRAWFQANRSRYEAVVREPALSFIQAAGPGLIALSSHLVADPRPVGGSLFRINRDIRFSPDKSPYKTVVGMSFGHDRGAGGAAPGLYLQLGPGDSFGGGGIHMPDTTTLSRVRDAIVARAGAWQRIVSDPGFQPYFAMEGETLKRAPLGYDPNHRHVEYLKRKSFTWHAHFSDDEVCDGDFIDRYLAACTAANGFQRFLARALGVPW